MIKMEEIIEVDRMNHSTKPDCLLEIRVAPQTSPLTWESLHGREQRAFTHVSARKDVRGLVRSRERARRRVAFLRELPSLEETQERVQEREEGGTGAGLGCYCWGRRQGSCGCSWPEGNAYLPLPSALLKVHRPPQPAFLKLRRACVRALHGQIHHARASTRCGASARERASQRLKACSFPFLSWQAAAGRGLVGCIGSNRVDQIRTWLLHMKHARLELLVYWLLSFFLGAIVRIITALICQLWIDI